ncbi:hypothetical protein PSTG_00807 [Puccinia striiformis f. sp. tritici PST-78]|uniref:Transmembrane protein n=1 Tax=Puccinia striiformis f. sp. tritici PST-78 TaxID=1165861 RepID=A0A0L0W462_9BASI|nr:hypothetical protein PSTG_00807 [Puccinia striiformis f. sp. tritici PST-78]
MRNDPRVVNGDTFGLRKPSMFTSPNVPEYDTGKPHLPSILLLSRTLLGKLKNFHRISASNTESFAFFVCLALWHVVVTIPVLLLLSA